MESRFGRVARVVSWDVEVFERSGLKAELGKAPLEAWTLWLPWRLRLADLQPGVVQGKGKGDHSK